MANVSGLNARASSSCVELTSVSGGATAELLPFFNMIESRMPGLLDLVGGGPKFGASFIGGGAGAAATDEMISGTACCECAKKDRDVSHR